MVGDGSYLMLNSEIATSVMLGTKLVIVVQDNRGYGCIHRLQLACGGEGFNNLFDDCVQAGRGRRRSTSPRMRARWARWPSTSIRSRSSRRRSRGRAPPSARTSWSSTPIRCGRPRRAAGGGKSACPRCRSRRRCAPRAPSTSTANGFRDRDEGRHELRRAHRHQSDLVDQRRPAGAGRRDAARDGAFRRQGDRLRRLRARQQVSARAGGAARGARAARARVRLRLVFGTSRAARSTTRSRRSRST